MEHKHTSLNIWFAAILLCMPVLAGCSSSEQASDPNTSAIYAIRTALELPDLPLEFVEITTAANSPTGRLPVASYRDTAGRLYFVDPAAVRVVEVDARSVLEEIPGGAELLPAEIQAKAMRLMAAAIPGFETLVTGLSYEEGGKIDNYFFSWRAPMQTGDFMPAFAQIAIHKSGIVFAYYNFLLTDR